MRRPSGTLPFAEPEASASSSNSKTFGSHIAYVDGASRGNPGPASYAVVLRAPDGKTVLEIGKYLGRATNNVAEYYGLITALDYAQAQGISRLLVRSDSQLLVRQMQGRYKVKSPDLRPLYERARKMAGALAHFAVEHIPRELNARADELANIALDKTGTHQPTPAATAAQSVTQSAPRSVASMPASNSPMATAPVAPFSVARALEARPAASGASRSTSSSVPSGGSGNVASNGSGNVASSVPSGASSKATKIRARFSAGALHPMQPLDLYEGEIVEIEIAQSGNKPNK